MSEWQVARIGSHPRRNASGLSMAIRLALKKLDHSKHHEHDPDLLIHHKSHRFWSYNTDILTCIATERRKKLFRLHSFRPHVKRPVLNQQSTADGLTLCGFRSSQRDHPHIRHPPNRNKNHCRKIIQILHSMAFTNMRLIELTCTSTTRMNTLNGPADREYVRMGRQAKRFK